MFRKESSEKIAAWIDKGDLDQFAKYLMSGMIHGKPGVPVAELSRVAKILREALTEGERYRLAKKLLVRPEYTARNIGTHLLASGWPKFKDIESWMRKAADDEDWIVREYAAGLFAALLEQDFAHFSKIYHKWARSESVNVKRAVALAVKYDSRGGDSTRWKTYFNLIDPLMGESAEYIRKNLGPFAIGDGLLKRFPKPVFTACKKWLKSGNENVRWNVAMIFTAAAARNFAKESRPILRDLVDDESAFVARAAKKALRNIDR